MIVAAHFKEFRDKARSRRIESYLPDNSKGYDYAKSNIKKNEVCGINKIELEQRLNKINVKLTTIEKGLMKVDKYELIRISIIDCMIYFGKTKEYAINIGNLAK